MPNYSVRVVAQHQLSVCPTPFRLIRVGCKQQLKWGVIKFLILKHHIKQYKNKNYDWDIDAKIYHLHTDIQPTNWLDVIDAVPNNSCLVYKRVPLHRRECIHYIPHLAVEYTRDVNENKIKTVYY